MTLDPVHFDGIAGLADRISHRVDATDHDAFAETVFEEFLDPLWHDGDRIVEPLGELRRRRIDIEDAALQDAPFPTQHGLDSGTINPTTFTNGLVIDIAHAAMAAVPSELSLHRSRTVVKTVHSNDRTVDCNEDDWSGFDRDGPDGDYFSRGRVLQAPHVNRYEEGVVHALSLYLAEVEHALDNAEAVEDLLVLDGPIYPKGLLAWSDRSPELADLLVENERPRDVVSSYLRLVEQFADRGVPLVGVVKNSASKAITRAVRNEKRAPWVNDAAFFERVLRRTGDDGELRTDALTFTNWFVSRCGVDEPLSKHGDALGLERNRPPEDYEVTFCCVFDPRTELLFRVEAPAVVTRDPELREALTMQLLRDIAHERGPPLAVAKADELARISRDEKRALVKTIEERFDAQEATDYNDERWTGPV
ncbi:NurA domain protein [Natronomonas pharaonis DSM 2160]|uniref:NurA domain protein n=1 Tax=Natronomonas pharaonis (strain ATCC 35678 / DSM 2160 / CIP 103997 / JCM 8858 / NBRC 14720 / NCIMB 2260 / Gabara) TaxID=348780 RepID=A0A1U7EW57_NATPD|nr:DNA double-strand break repair nuclease NurA [Natronomonas pharaonis]CAI49308.1 NurA domain protein [Natronomonas pharaonis DSM 2160]